MLDKIINTTDKYYMNTFGSRTPVCFTHGSGIKLYDTDGNAYNDFFAGIAVTALGHAHPEFTKGLQEQAGKLLHTSSLYYIESQAELAKHISENTCADRVFLCNSGAEANEGAIKLAKMYFYKKGEDRTEIITLVNSFHGRTVTTVAATGQEKYQKPYRPLTPGFSHAVINDYEMLENMVTEKTAAIMLEFIQGEGGVHPVDSEYIKKVRRLCDEKGILLIADEVQTGMGRTGKLFAYENFGVEPDIFTSAKALGNGIPIGAVCAKEEVASAFSPGDHGSTFGGNPFASKAGCLVFEIMKKEKLTENAADMGKYFREKLSELKGFGIKEIRGMGLLIGVEIPEAGEIVKKMFEKKYLIGTAGASVLRILPPLTVTKNDIDGFITALSEVLKERNA